MNQTTYDRGIIKGRQEGLENGQRSLLRILMEERFGPLPTSFVDRLQTMTMDELIQLGKAAVKVNSIEELRL
ncbi:MAG: DUF4351 domain-containing protein [Gemmataceae bacterium]|nr:DUF4351 domain-containing protein [Gemmataceae bacterium]